MECQYRKTRQRDIEGMKTKRIIGNEVKDNKNTSERNGS